MNKMIKVYHGQVYDDLLSLAEEWAVECRAYDFGLTVSANEHLRDLQRLVDGADSCLLVYYINNLPVGYFGITTFKSPIGHELIANEHYWFVSSANRQMGVLRLLQAAKEWALLMGCGHLLLNASNMASSKHDGVCKLYERQGAKHFETTYLLEI